MLSVVVPCYNEEEAIPYFYQAMEEIQTKIEYTFEYIFVNDGSSDNTLAVLRELYQKNPESVRFLSFSRNFGKEAGIYAGLQEATGELVTIMDVDLQDPPELLIEMITLIEQKEYDCIGSRRISRVGEPPIRSLFAKLFYNLQNKISDTHMVDGARDYRLMTRQMTDAVLQMSEYNRFSKGLFEWVGFKTHYLEFENVERQHGQTSWSFWSLFKYSIDGIINFSAMPLRIATVFGSIFSVLSFIGILFIVFRALVNGIDTPGWASTACIILFIGGIQLLALGVIGEYIGKIFLETKNRPLYIIKEKNPAAK
ncbi:glycosyltransferase family 2 protein [Pilibacter termitis]|uniref:glycosyltransferase family 2 protein n=1 Tax=Pilibacter termitis TaxID=263852 RepID=UPI000999F43A|nr:glycosyltransferase family 2 protein [Pilibacter termitis]